MTTQDYRADETALLRAIDQLPNELFTAYRGGWPDGISLALIDAVYSLHPSYEADHPQRGITSRIFQFVHQYPAAEDSLGSLVQLDEADIRQTMGYAKTGVKLRSEAILDAARGMLGLSQPIVEAGDLTTARLKDVRRVFDAVQGLGRVAFTYFVTNLGVAGALAGPMLTRFVARHATGDQNARLPTAQVVWLVERAYRRNHRGCESVSHFEYALWLAERRRHAP